MYLVDTNVLSDARRGSPEARDWLRSVDPDSVFLSVVTLGEIMRGTALRARQDTSAAASLTRWLDQLQSTYADRILPVDSAVALEWGRIAAIRPRGMADGLIAATARVRRATLATRNISDFDDLDISIVNPWDRLG